MRVGYLFTSKSYKMTEVYYCPVCGEEHTMYMQFTCTCFDSMAEDTSEESEQPQPQPRCGGCGMPSAFEGGNCQSCENGD